MPNLYKVSSNPHIRSRLNTQSIMFVVIVALLPATGYGISNFGMRALAVILVTIAACVLTEALYGVVRHKQTISDLSAIVTGLLLALNLPPKIPMWMAALGGVFAILVVKCLFGGLGCNIMNPALAARCFLLISFPAAMTDYATDAYTGATPLALVKAGEDTDTVAMFFGGTAGCIGETSVLCILIGAVILIAFKVIDLKIPLSYILTFAVFVLIFGGRGLDFRYLAGQLCGGGLMLGAFFMATDYVTRPDNGTGQIVYGIFLGLMTGILRIFGPGSEGVSYAIIIGNLLVPLIEKITAPKPFGYVKPAKPAKPAKAAKPPKGSKGDAGEVEANG